MNDDKKSIFINAVDKEMHQSVLRLEQKLRGLQAEIDSKIEALSLESDQTVATQSQIQLTALSDEVKKVLVNIKRLLNLEVDEDAPAGQYAQLNHEELEEFKETIKLNIELISRLKDEF